MGEIHMSSTTLPKHALTGMSAIGWRKPRRGETEYQPIWPVLGGAEDEETPDEGEEGADDDSDTDDADSDSGSDDDAGESEGSETLGDAGKRALDKMKSKWHSEREKRRKTEQELNKLKGSEDKTSPSAEEIRQEAEKAATSKANARIVRSEVRAAAAGKLADPKDALTFLDLDQFEVDENGEVDTDEVADAIDDLLKNKPYLSAQGKRFQGTGDGGAARKASKPKQLTRDDLKRMSPEQIAKAQDEGRCQDLLAGK